MTTVFEKYEIAAARFERYENEIEELAKAQLRVATDVFCDPKVGRNFARLPRGMHFKYFKPCNFVKVNRYSPKTIEAWWNGTGGDSDNEEGTFEFHPFMLDETKPVSERVELLRQYFLGVKTAADEAENELRLALLAQQRRQLESQIIAIDQQLRRVCTEINQQLKEDN